MTDNSNKVRVLLLSGALDPGGTERQLVTLAKALDKSIFDVSVCLFYDRGALRKDLENTPGVELFSLNKKGRWDVFSSGAHLVRELRRRRPHVVYSFLPGPNIYAIPCAKLAGNVKIAWGIRASDKDLKGAGWFARLFYFLERSLARFPDVIVSNSHAGAADIIARGFPRDRVTVIPNGIDTHRFTKNVQKGRVLREKWGIPSDCTLIGIVASLRPMKGHRVFLKAAKIIAVQNNAVRFVCVGPKPGPSRQELEDLASQLGIGEKVIWAGSHSDMGPVYGALDILCSASVEHEGFSNSIGEAMSCSVPCVVTDVGDSARIVGDCGRVVPPGDHEKLAFAIQNIMKRIAIDPDLCQKSRLRIQENFDTALLAERTSRIVHKILGWTDGR
ncbi:MAG: glycosyltransferase [Desulfatibacillum sp.]|nr:glycosyltransferase [Desulfatibacillum sp.]